MDLSQVRDYKNWKSRPEIIGDRNFEQGAKMANPDGQVDMKYGVHIEGGAGQMNTVFSRGTCRDSGVITKSGKAKID